MAGWCSARKIGAKAFRDCARCRHLALCYLKIINHPATNCTPAKAEAETRQAEEAQPRQAADEKSRVAMLQRLEQSESVWVFCGFLITVIKCAWPEVWDRSETASGVETEVPTDDGRTYIGDTQSSGVRRIGRCFWDLGGKIDRRSCNDLLFAHAQTQTVPRGSADCGRLPQ